MNQRPWLRLTLAESTNAPFGAGAYVPGVILLVGEQANNPESSPNQQPFCCDSGSSGWLNNLLEEEQIPESQLFWINALNNDHSEVDIFSVCRALTPRLVIALGRVAAERCKRQHVPHVPCAHPQYWKRFHHKKRYPLLDLLRENITRKESDV